MVFGLSLLHCVFFLFPSLWRYSLVLFPLPLWFSPYFGDLRFVCLAPFSVLVCEQLPFVEVAFCSLSFISYFRGTLKVFLVGLAVYVFAFITFMPRAFWADLVWLNPYPVKRSVLI